MTIEALPQAQHRGAAELPFAEIGGGNKLKVIQVDVAEGLWIVENIFQAGYAVQTHRHTGPVYGYTVSGAWRYREYDYVNRAGSFLFEPAGSVHTLECIEDDTRCGSRCTGSTSTWPLTEASKASSTAPVHSRLLRPVRGEAFPDPTYWSAEHQSRVSSVVKEN